MKTKAQHRELEIMTESLYEIYSGRRYGMVK